MNHSADGSWTDERFSTPEIQKASEFGDGTDARGDALDVPAMEEAVVSTRANSSEGLTTVSTELFRSPLSLLSNSKTHSAAGNRESKCQGFNDRTFLAGENPCRGCSKRARSPKASSLSKTPERLKHNKPTG